MTEKPGNQTQKEQGEKSKKDGRKQFKGVRVTVQPHSDEVHRGSHPRQREEDKEKKNVGENKGATTENQTARHLTQLNDEQTKHNVQTAVKGGKITLETV